ncbi:hypothetical protein EI94DRAFT_1798675 [Lactarius quietus]|nr:hypothetical protein EI94DRAFT_1798675 [Lactarius quietus]
MRDWWRPLQPVFTTEYATYHTQKALAGKELGNDVGQWFGPSTAASAINEKLPRWRTHRSVDSMVFRMDVYSASHLPTQPPRPRKLSRWRGGRGVVLLIGVRLDVGRVHPIKPLCTFSQAVGIAGGRPSSSYYFIGSQADKLLYLDPDDTRTTILLRPPTQPTEREREPIIVRRLPASSRTGSSTFSYQTASPSPLSKQLSTSSPSSRGAHIRWSPAALMLEDELEVG